MNLRMICSILRLELIVFTMMFYSCNSNKKAHLIKQEIYDGKVGFNKLLDSVENIVPKSKEFILGLQLGEDSLKAMHTIDSLIKINKIGQLEKVRTAFIDYEGYPYDLYLSPKYKFDTHFLLQFDEGRLIGVQFCCDYPKDANNIPVDRLNIDSILNLLQSRIGRYNSSVHNIIDTPSHEDYHWVDGNKVTTLSEIEDPVSVSDFYIQYTSARYILKKKKIAEQIENIEKEVEDIKMKNNINDLK